MTETQATKAARALEKQRRRLLGEDASITFRVEGATGNIPHLTISVSFMVERKSNLVIGEEYLEAQIAEQTGVTAGLFREVLQADYAGAIWTVRVIEMAITAARVYVLRLDAAGAN